jgi:hypothetical protein
VTKSTPSKIEAPKGSSTKTQAQEKTSTPTAIEPVSLHQKSSKIETSAPPTNNGLAKHAEKKLEEDIMQDSDNDYSADYQSTQASPLLQDRTVKEAAIDLSKKGGIDFIVANFKLEYSDLNECVAQLLKKAKDDGSVGGGRDIKRRQRKNKDQLKVLENEFLKSPDWTREFIRRISQRLQLRECQVYKWHWDQRKKEGMAAQTYV